MSHQPTQTDTSRQTAGPADTTSLRRGKVLVLITEDWFALSHFQPLIKELVGLFQEVAIATRIQEGQADLEALGARVIAFDYHRQSINPLTQWKVAGQLAQLVARERPDAIHAISQHVITTTSLAMRWRFNDTRFVMHWTGFGVLAKPRTLIHKAYRQVVKRTIARSFRSGARLIVENLHDARKIGIADAETNPSVILCQGAGVDPDEFICQPPPENDVPRAAFVGRMLTFKGLLVLEQAMQELARRGVSIEAHCYGPGDANTASIAAEKLKEWTDPASPIRWHGRSSDIPGVWKQSDICVMPSLGGEGLPRAVLEAAGSARPLIVTDVPGCRDFVRHGREGLIVKPGNVAELAEALARLAADPALRIAMGEAARARLLEAFSERTIRERYRLAYRD